MRPWLRSRRPSRAPASRENSPAAEESRQPPPRDHNRRCRFRCLLLFTVSFRQPGHQFWWCTTTVSCCWHLAVTSGPGPPTRRPPNPSISRLFAGVDEEGEANALGSQLREWVESAGGYVHPALQLSLATPHGSRLYRPARKQRVLPHASHNSMPSRDSLREHVCMVECIACHAVNLCGASNRCQTSC